MNYFTTSFIFFTDIYSWINAGLCSHFLDGYIHELLLHLVQIFYIHTRMNWNRLEFFIFFFSSRVIGACLLSGCHLWDCTIKGCPAHSRMIINIKLIQSHMVALVQSLKKYVEHAKNYDCSHLMTHSMTRISCFAAIYSIYLLIHQIIKVFWYF